MKHLHPFDRLARALLKTEQLNFDAMRTFDIARITYGVLALPRDPEAFPDQTAYQQEKIQALIAIQTALQNAKIILNNPDALKKLTPQEQAELPEIWTALFQEYPELTC
jgi:hypothetical protein